MSLLKKCDCGLVNGYCKPDICKSLPVKELHPQEVKGEKDGWINEKPEFDKDSIMITASWWNIGDGYWEYSIWQIVKLESEEGWYWGLLMGDGDEWGALEDFRADKYKVLPPLPTPPQTINEQ